MYCEIPDPVNIEEIPLKEHHGVYIPSPYYFLYEPLPKEWTNMIKRTEYVKNPPRVSHSQFINNY